jgi:hypothetical protein
LLDELQASPRADGEAEQLALEAAGTLTAPADVYTRIHADLSMLRQQFPEVSGIHMRPTWSPSTLGLGVDDVGFAAMNDGTYGWDCQNARYGMTDWTPETSGSSHTATLRFGNRVLNMPIVATAYAWLPHQLSPPSTDWLIGDGSDVCVSSGEDTYSYVFKRGEGDCPAGCTELTYWAFSTGSDGTAQRVGTYQVPGSTARPEWLAPNGRCTKWF